MLEIVVADPLPFEDAHYRRLQALGPVRVHDVPPKTPTELIARLADCDAAVVGWCDVTADVLAALPRLRFLSLWAAGTNLVAMDAAKRHGVLVSVTQGYADTAVAEFTVGAMLALTRKIWPAALRMRDGHRDWRPYLGRDLSSLVIGVVGAGSIGCRVIGLLQGFGAEVLVSTLHPTPTRATALGVTFVELDHLLERSDVVSLHLPLDPNTQGLIDADRLRRMKPQSILINTSRAGLIDTESLVRGLIDGHLGGAALDVFEVEPPRIDPAWFEIDNLLLTPHIAFNSAGATRTKNELCIGNVEAFASGSPTHLA